MADVGRAVWEKKRTTDSCCRIDMTYLAKQVRFDMREWFSLSWKSSWGRRDSILLIVEPPDRVRLQYTSTNRTNGISVDHNHVVFIESTPCNYGGKRWWFECPKCHRRCRIIYLAPGFDYFVCRICGNLIYESQQEGKSRWWALRQGIVLYPAMQDKYLRTRSPRKRAILRRKLNMMEAGQRKIIEWGKRLK